MPIMIIISLRFEIFVLFYNKDVDAIDTFMKLFNTKTILNKYELLIKATDRFSKRRYVPTDCEPNQDLGKIALLLKTA